MGAILEDGKLRLSGYVGDYYYSDGFTSDDVVMALAQVDDASDLDCYINSPGGVATEGAAIHALLMARKGTTNIVVEGIAASAASLIAMAGAKVTMSAGSIMMIHDPSGITVGTSADHQKSIESLEALATSYARVYAGKSGKSADECRTVMKDETWLTPEQAVAAGFADETTEKVKAVAVAAFDYRLYAKAPQDLRALAESKNWSFDPRTDHAATAAPPRPKEIPMTDKSKTEPGSVDLDQVKADATADATKTANTTAADIVDVCVAAGVPAMASVLIKEGVTLEQAKARTGIAKDIRTAVDLAKTTYPKIEASADEFIAAGFSMDQVRAKLFEKITAAQSPEIKTGHQAATGADEAAQEAAKIVATYRGVTGTEKGRAA